MRSPRWGPTTSELPHASKAVPCERRSLALPRHGRGPSAETDGVVETVRRAVDGGVRIVQLRDKDATDAETVDQLVALSQAIDGRALLVVNDRLDAAVAARERGARVDGVHLGQGDASVLRARKVLGPEALIGLTANSSAHLDAVDALPSGTVDYLGVGVIRPTTTKPDHPAPLGRGGLSRPRVAKRPAVRGDRRGRHG